MRLLKSQSRGGGRRYTREKRGCNARGLIRRLRSVKRKQEGEGGLEMTTKTGPNLKQRVSVERKGGDTRLS